MTKPTVFKTSLLPFQVASMLLEDETGKRDLVHSEYHTPLQDDKQFCVLIFERFYKRTTSNATLTVIMENTGGPSLVKCIATGSTTGIFGIDWGIAKEFVNWVENRIKSYIIE